MTAAVNTVRTMLRAAAGLGRRPDLWPTAIGSYRTLVPQGWWRARPFLPLPDSRWLRFRLVTAYGGDGAVPKAGIDTDDMILWLEWRRSWPH